MRIGPEWIYSKEGWDDLPEGVDDPTWLALGAFIGDLGGLILVISLITGGIGVYRLRGGQGRTTGASSEGPLSSLLATHSETSHDV